MMGKFKSNIHAVSSKKYIDKFFKLNAEKMFIRLSVENKMSKYFF